MLLEFVEAENFRNIRGKIELDQDLTVLVGNNGQGKTNWLEAIYALATTRSFKTAKLSETIKFGEELGVIRGRVRRSQEITRGLQTAIQGNIKVISVNGKRISAAQYAGELHAVLFDAASLEIVRGAPEHRRRFLDDTIVSVHPPYLRTISEYARVLKQKNRLLQNAQRKELDLQSVTASLEPWNEQLALLAEKIHLSRVRITERLTEQLSNSIFDRELIALRYRSSLEEKGDLTNFRELISERLQLRVQAELAAAHSLIGPHRDDLEILFDGRDMRKFGSSGQQRSTVLSLLLAGVEVYSSLHEEYPLFLIDDIDAELDAGRIKHLLEHLSGRCQTIVTTTKRGMIEKIGLSSLFVNIENGLANIQPVPIAQGN